jgi:predicted CopG family antitoxin
VYGYQNAITLKKLEIPDVVKELEEVYRKVDARIVQYGELRDEEMKEAIQEHRKKERASI